MKVALGAEDCSRDVQIRHDLSKDRTVQKGVYLLQSSHSCCFNGTNGMDENGGMYFGRTEKREFLLD